MAQKKVVKLTEGNTLKQIILFTIPLIGGAIFQQLYNIADTMIVGRFVGVDALAAVGATGSLNFLVLGFTMGLTSGCGIPISHAYGADNHKRMLNVIANSAYLSVGFAIFLTLGTHFMTNTVLNWMHTPANIFQMSYNYISIIFSGMVFTVIYNFLASICRSIGDSNTPLIFLIFSSILNVILDLVLIIFFNLGVSGAAIATIFSQAVSGLLCFLYMKKKHTILRFAKEDLRFNGQEMKNILAISVPMALQMSITAVGTVILQVAVNSLGSDKVAAVTAGQKIEMLFTQPMVMLGTAMSVFCGQNYGANQKDRIFKGIREATILVFAYAIGCFLVMKVAGGDLTKLFVDGSAAGVIADSKRFLGVNSMFYWLLGTIFIYRNCIQGLGQSSITMLAGFAELAARSFMALVLVSRFGFNAVLYANPFSWLCACLILVPTLFRITRKLKETM